MNNEPIVNQNKSRIVLLILVLLISCDSDNSGTENFPTLNISLRLEVQMRDSIYNLYPVPCTTMYFHTFILFPDGHTDKEEFSQTTTCPNGWGVKELNYILTDESQKVVLGAGKSNNTLNDYTYTEITYREFLNQAEDSYNVRVIKTFGIH